MTDDLKAVAAAAQRLLNEVRITGESDGFTSDLQLVADYARRLASGQAQQPVAWMVRVDQGMGHYHFKALTLDEAPKGVEKFGRPLGFIDAPPTATPERPDSVGGLTRRAGEASIGRIRPERGKP